MQPRVLFVDDDPAVTAGIVRALRRAVPWKLITSNSPHEALALIGREPVDVVVSDERMPGMLGSELLSHVARENPGCVRIMLTGQASLDSAIRAINEAGIYRFLTKPCRTEDLIACVGDALRARSAIASAAEAPAPGHGRADVEAAIASLGLAFQPIVSYSLRRAFGYEALMRPESQLLPDPGALLKAAERENMTAAVDGRVFELVARSVADAPPDVALFVNLHPRTLLEPMLFDAGGDLARVASRIVLEVTERSALDDVPDIESRIGALRDLGYRIAVDDLGSGYSGLTYLVHLKPDLVKFDRELVRDVHESPPRQKLVRSMELLCRELGIRTVAEGIESPAERDFLVSAGCDLLQGYLFARPAKGFVEPHFGDPA